MSDARIIKNLISSTGFSRADCKILMKAFKMAFKEELIRTHALTVQGLGAFKVKQSRDFGYYVRFYPEKDFETILFAEQGSDDDETLFE